MERVMSWYHLGIGIVLIGLSVFWAFSPPAFVLQRGLPAWLFPVVFLGMGIFRFYRGYRAIKRQKQQQEGRP